MADKFLGPKIKVERAEEHLTRLVTELEIFLDSQPYDVRTKRDPQTQRLIYYIASVRDLPPLIPAIAGDVIQNLRSSLDYLAYQLVISGSRSASPSRHVYFPVADSQASYELKKVQQLRGADQNAINAIDALQPYKGGNDTLWQIHGLNNIDKHRLLVAVGSAFRSLDIGHVMMRKMAEAAPHLANLPTLSAFFKPADRMCPLKSGDELFIDEPGATEDNGLQFRFELAFHEPQVAEDQEILETLRKMCDSVQKVITTLGPFV